MHLQILLRSTPLNPQDPQPEDKDSSILQRELFDALSALNNTPAPGEVLSERDILRQLAGKPIVRPTSASISGNIDEVITARYWISYALKNKLGGEALEQLKAWLGTFKSETVKDGWREAMLRARGVKAGEELERMMQLASGVKGKRPQLKLRFDVCFHCGIPI